MSERLRSSSSRSSLSIEAPNRSLQTLPFHTVSNVWSLSPAAGWGVEHRDLPCVAQKPSVHVRLKQRQPASDWTITDNSSTDLCAFSFHVIHRNSPLKAVLPGGILQRQSGLLCFWQTNEMFLWCRQYRSHRTLLQYHELHHECVVAWDFCGAHHFLWHMAANVFRRYWMALLSAASL